MSTRTIDLWQGLLLWALLLSCAVVYQPGLNGPFLFDDIHNIVLPLNFWDRGYTHWLEIVFANGSGFLGRPLSIGSFVLSWTQSANDPYIFKLHNLLIHLSCGVLIFLVSRSVFKELNSSNSVAGWLALFTMALWLHTPFHLSTVLYVVQRMAQLSALFMFAGMLSYIVGRRQVLDENRFGWLLIALSLLLFYPLAVVSKENSLVFPLVLLLTEYTVFQFYGCRSTRRILAVLFICITILPFATVSVWLLFNMDWLLKGYEYRVFTLIERVLTEFRVTFDYLRNILIPDVRGMGIFHDDYPLSTGLLSPYTTLLSIITWVGIIAGVFAVQKGDLRRILIFGLGVFGIGHLLESTIYPLEIYFEHRNYFPSFGIYIVFTYCLYYLIRRFSIRLSVSASVIVLLPVLFAVTSYSKATLWSDKEVLYTTALDSHPLSVRVHTGLAHIYSISGHVGAALHQLDRVIEISPENRSGVTLQKALIFCPKGRKAPDLIYEELGQNLSFFNEPYVNSVLIKIMDLMVTGMCPGLDALRFSSIIDQWLRRDPNGATLGRWGIEVRLSSLFYAVGLENLGDEVADIAWNLAKDRLEPYILKVESQISRGDYAGAKATLSELVMRQSESLFTYENRLGSYEKLLVNVQ